MSSLTAVDKRYLEAILRMGGGFVLDFTDHTFRELFNTRNVDIHSERYQTYGTSKSKKLRAFWEKESDSLVGPVLSEMLDLYEAECELAQRDPDSVPLARARAVASRLAGTTLSSSTMTDQGFLSEEFAIPALHNVAVDPPVAEIIRDRLNEAQLCLQIGAHLSVIFQCGSVLEAVLLGAAQKQPLEFNRSRSSPKRHDGKVKSFHEWTLAELINVAHDIGLLKADVQKFSHGLRDFRNYIHPYEQMVSGFRPDEHTAKLCFRVLKAALADVSGER